MSGLKNSRNSEPVKQVKTRGKVQKKKDCYIHFKGKTYMEKNMVFANGCIVKERPKGHKKYYYYHYYRIGGRLRKKYIRPEELEFTKMVFAEMKRRNTETAKGFEEFLRRLKLKGLL